MATRKHGRKHKRHLREIAYKLFVITMLIVLILPSLVRVVQTMH